MDRFSAGHLIDATYRVESVLSENPRAQVYVVTHVRYPEVPLVLKVAAAARAEDFERDTHALASLTSPSVARVCDRGSLDDGRPYRVVERLAGPTLRDALGSDPFDRQRATELVVALASAVHEAHASGLGPCDLSIDNLVFKDGRNSRLCMMRALSANVTAPDPEADHAALARLRSALARDSTQTGAHDPAEAKWKPPSSLKELRDALAGTGGQRTPDSSAPGAQIRRWEVVQRLSETLRATVYEVRSSTGVPGILKVAGPEADHAHFKKHAQVFASVQSRNVVRILDVDAHEGTPYVVMDPLYLSQSRRLAAGAPLGIDAALQTVDELLWGALAIDKSYGAPSDFSLEHCYQATSAASPAVLTHALMRLPTFRLQGRAANADDADTWSAAVALYELIAGRLPFPTSKHSLAKAWIGMPLPLGSHRPDVPRDISELVHGILMGTRMKTAELRRELTRIRSTPGAIRSSIPPPLPRGSITPAERIQPPPRAVITPQMAANVFSATVPDARGASSFPQGGSVVPPGGSVVPPGGSVVPPGGSVVPPEARRVSVEPPGIAPPRRSSSPPATTWTLATATARCPITTIVCAAFGAGGAELVAVGSEAVARYRDGRWTLDPAREGAAEVSKLLPMSGDAYLALTNAGGLRRLGPSGGAFERWGVPLERIAFRGAAPNGDGFTLVGGTTDHGRGVVARLSGESLTVVADDLPTKPLRAAAHCGRMLLAAAEGGSIVLLEDGVIAESVRPCEVDLLAVGQTVEGAVVVGTGAFAYRVALRPLFADLEPVETVSALTCLAISGAEVWAGSDRGRILRRVRHRWRRQSPAFPNDPAVRALHVSPSGLTALLADGTLVTGLPEV